MVRGSLFMIKGVPIDIIKNKDSAMDEFLVSNPDFIQIVKKSFSKQGLMRHLGATMDVIEPGHVSITMPFSDDLTQQHDYYHAGSLTWPVEGHINRLKPD